MDAFGWMLRSLLEPPLALLDPGKRVFWPFLLGAAVMAALVGSWGQGRRTGLLRYLFPRCIWLHPSALLDYKLVFVKALLRALLLAPRLLSTLAVAATVAVWLRRIGGPPPALAASALTVGLLYTLVAFVADDASRFWLHRLMHRVPWLWELHKVHHSARVLTPVTLYRTHPIESLLSGARGAVVVGTVTGVFTWLFGRRVQGWEVLGVDAIGFVWSLLGANLRHSHVPLSYGPRLEHLLISPAQHQIHHSSDPRHADSNFGTVLAVWDWMGGSLRVARRGERLRFGLPAGERNHGDGVVSVLLAPLRASARALVRSARSVRPAYATAGLGVLLLLGGCAGKRLDRAALLREMGECALATYREAHRRGEALLAATRTAADAPDPASRMAARQAWVQLMETWQQAELLQMGPAASAPSPGALGLRGAIYAWPDVNRCLIEQQIVNRLYEGELFSSVPVSSRGLGALEYLLFYEGGDNACPPESAINRDGSWAALSAEELARRRAAYARAAAVDLQARLGALVAAWEPTGGNFLTQLAAAGQGSTVFATQQQALGAVAEALFYLDPMVKDAKLGRPLGLHGCNQPTCPEALESPWAGRGKEHLYNNLLGARKLLLGCGTEGAGLGFDDLLVSAGAGEVARSLEQDLEAALGAIAALGNRSLGEALAADREAVHRIRAAVKRMTDVLKGEFLMVLQITPSKRVEGDQD
ncbi:MAG: imelysin family protein [Myxococcales bacterium]|nr:sterol desaturase family protein [Myxococcota bacterium]MDW8282677.1 imelysin family protein [Myxococcales bacterium]